jgi:hypothetical protein
MACAEVLRFQSLVSDFGMWWYLAEKVKGRGNNLNNPQPFVATECAETTLLVDARQCKGQEDREAVRRPRRNDASAVKRRVFALIIQTLSQVDCSTASCAAPRRSCVASATEDGGTALDPSAQSSLGRKASSKLDSPTNVPIEARDFTENGKTGIDCERLKRET